MSPGLVDMRTARDAMIVSAEVHGALTTVGAVRLFFEDDHKHCAVIADDRRVLAVVVRTDLVGAHEDDLAHPYGTLTGRVTDPESPLEAVRRRMVEDGLRRLAVVDAERRLVGLLCLKSTGLGFCSGADVQARVDHAGLRLRTAGS